VDEEAEEEDNMNKKRTRLAAVEEWICEIQEAVEEENEAEEKRWKEEYEDEEIGWDDVRGGVLRAADVAAARAEEIKYMVGRKIWNLRTVEECWRKTGKGPKSVRWVDTNKGTEDRPEVRSRLVVMDFKGKGPAEDEFFAQTPPLEALRMQMSRAATVVRMGNGGVGERRKMLFIDAKKAHLNPPRQPLLVAQCKFPHGMAD
jgi:hypothetical protein